MSVLSSLYGGDMFLSSQEEKKNRVIKHLATLQIIRKKMIKVMEK